MAGSLRTSWSKFAWEGLAAIVPGDSAMSSAFARAKPRGRRAGAPRPYVRFSWNGQSVLYSPRTGEGTVQRILGLAALVATLSGMGCKSPEGTQDRIMLASFTTLREVFGRELIP